MESSASRPVERRAALRTAVVWEACRRWLDEAGGPVRVVDIGGGTGGFAVKVAELGHRVTVVDPNPDALAALARRADERGVTDRITAVQGDLAGVVDQLGADAADLVLCHGVLGVLDDQGGAGAALEAIGRLLDTGGPTGGALSLVVGQRHAAALHRAVAGQFAEARALVAGDSPRAGQERRFTAAELVELLHAAGFEPERMQAIRVFADLVPSALLDLEPGAAEELLTLERAVAERPEYLVLAGQVHVLARPATRGRGDGIGSG